MKKTKIILALSSITLFAFPFVVSAAGITDLIKAAFGIVTNTLIPLAFALCLFYFFWGVAQYIRTGAAGKEPAQEAKKVMLWGIVGIFVVFSVWGIIKFIQSEIGIPGIGNIKTQKV